MSMTPRPYQWVTERIALGGAIWLEEVPLLRQDGITHVLDCRLRPLNNPSYKSTGIQYRHCGIADDGKSKPDEWFFQGIDFVLKALIAQHSKVLIHCKFGMSRSPSMVYAILRVLDVSPDEAVERIRKTRGVARVTYREDAERASLRWKKQQ
jgi:protein-tyrosine phosphatase